MAYTVRRSEPDAKYAPQNRPHLVKEVKKGYTDFAVRSNPLCRWNRHLRRRVEVAASIRCRIFYYISIIISEQMFVNIFLQKVCYFCCFSLY